MSERINYTFKFTVFIMRRLLLPLFFLTFSQAAILYACPSMTTRVLIDTEISILHRKNKQTPTSLSNSDNFDNYNNPALTSIRSKPNRLSTLSDKTIFAKNRYAKTHKLQDLKLYFETSLLAVDLIDLIKRGHTQYNIPEKKLADIYEHSLYAAYKLHELTGDIEYLHKAFNIAERGKSQLLLQSLNETAAHRIGRIPDSLAAAERNLEISISFYEKQLFAAEQSKDLVKIAMCQNHLFEKNAHFEELIKQLKINFPDYYRLKYTTKITSVDAVQASLSEGVKLIEYFLGDSAVYIFDITKRNYRLHKILKPEGFENYLAAFQESLTAVGFTEFVKGNQLKKKACFRKWNTQNQFLSNLLLSPVLDDFTNRLIIIPDGVLGYLPFEVLLTENYNDPVPDFSKLPYLVKSHKVSYAYSATLLLESDNGQQTTGTKKDLKPFAGFAPNYTKQIAEAGNPLQNDVTALSLRNELTPLRFNTGEINTAAKFFDGTAYTGIKASKQTFQAEAKNYNILHLAMHTIIDDKNPMFSSLVFSDVDVSISNYLEASELYNMKLNARLAVLSACETGYGKLERSEGIMSLSRAFSYAGVPSLLISLWKIDDEASSKLMTNFYKYIKDGKSIDEAARNAKTDYLKQNAHPVYSHPFFWAAFVPVGDMSSVEIKRENNLIVPLTAVAVLLIIGAFIGWRRYHR